MPRLILELVWDTSEPHNSLLKPRGGGNIGLVLSDPRLLGIGP